MTYYTYPSATLAFVVLYNLNNVNISERIREVATLRVLGFYPRELTSYIYRDNTSVYIRILLGYAGGIGLTHLILEYITPSNIQLVSNIQWYNYIVSAVLTYLFIFMVMLIVHKS
ncbi:FtsX-like permease family protein [Fenollaria sporofastidiosus]|uniref:FtsX-like permease family protein n=1 Tax=Fenollaria sporofastidiosus TaxID=2811778 RepID=UPI0035A5C5F7